MGIQGLLPFLKNAAKPASIKDYKGCTVAIDSYCWLHRGAFACAEKLAMGEKTNQYVHYCMKFINNLLSFGIKPIMVFDGCHLPSKKDVEKQRRERRATHRKKAAQFLREGKRKEARDSLVQCIDITSQMALELMQACREKGVDCIVAPYEADAQLAYLNKIGVAQIIITEDSDLILFGCEKVMFKMDVSGYGVIIEQKDLNQAIGAASDHFTFEKFRHMCILSGCDYLPSLPGVGLARALKALKLTRQTDISMVLKKLPTLLKSNTMTVDQGYIDGFMRAENTFLYQLVYDPLKRSLVPLNPYPPELDPSQLGYAGPWLSESKALQVALGNIDIYTGEKMANFNPDHANWVSTSHNQSKPPPHQKSIWDPTYRTMSSQPADQTPVHDVRSSTKGLEFTAKSTPTITKKSLKRSHGIAINEEDLGDMGALYSMSVTHTPNQTDPLPPLPKKPYTTDTFSQLYDNEDNDKATENQLDMDNDFITVSTAESKTRPKYNPLKSPRVSKNKFAAKSPNEKFNLNAEKKMTTQADVKSRFFSVKEPRQKSSFFTELDKNHRSAKKMKMNQFVFHNAQSPQPSSGDNSDGDEEAEVTLLSNGDAHSSHSIELGSDVVTIVCGDVDSTDFGSTRVKTESPQSSHVPFSKLSNFKSKFDSKNDESSLKLTLSSTKGVCQQFKPVAISSQTDRFESRSPLNVTSEVVQSQESTSSIVSQKVDLYSFDADNWELSQGLTSDGHSQTTSSDDQKSRLPLLPLLPRSPSPGSRSSPDLDSTSGTTGVDHVMTHSHSESVMSASKCTDSALPSSCPTTGNDIKSSTKKLLNLSSCKVVGLSRKQAKKSQTNTGRSSNENQPGISCYFSSKFSFQKRSVDKITPTQKLSPLSPKKPDPNIVPIVLE